MMLNFRDCGNRCKYFYNLRIGNLDWINTARLEYPVRKGPKKLKTVEKPHAGMHIYLYRGTYKILPVSLYSKFGHSGRSIPA